MGQQVRMATIAATAGARVGTLCRREAFARRTDRGSVRMVLAEHWMLASRRSWGPRGGFPPSVELTLEDENSPCPAPHRPALRATQTPAAIAAATGQSSTSTAAATANPV